MARVLVVDDDAPNRNAMARLCWAMDLEVSTAENGTEALRQMRRSSFEVVLLDLFMPELDGFGVLEALQREPIVPRPAVILITGAPDVRGRLRGSELGALDFVEKPARREDLERRVRHALAVVEVEARVTEAQRTLENLRGRDEPTGAGSFGQLYGVLEAQFRAASLSNKPISCALIADEGFTRVLAEGGRAAGDARLRRVAQVIETTIRPTDFLFRIDAAEFVVIAPASDADSIWAIAAIVRDRLVVGGVVAPVELAMAVASYPYAGIDQAGSLYRAANVALARARLTPENGVVAYS